MQISVRFIRCPTVYLLSQKLIHIFHLISLGEGNMCLIAFQSILCVGSYFTDVETLVRLRQPPSVPNIIGVHRKSAATDGLLKLKVCVI